MQHFTSTFIVN